MKFLLLVSLLFPVFCFSQHFSPKVQFGGGYAFYIGSATSGNINGDYAKVGLKSGFTGEATVSQRVYKFLHVGLGGSFLKFNPTNAYVPVYAEVKAMGGGRVKPYAFVRPGYGIYKGTYWAPLFNNTEHLDILYVSEKATQQGGFYIGYGAGVALNIFYLQAAYQRLTFKTNSTNQLSNSGNQGYGVIALTAGVRLP